MALREEAKFEKLKEEATALEIPFTSDVSAEQLAGFITNKKAEIKEVERKAAEEKKAAEAEEKRIKKEEAEKAEKALKGKSITLKNTVGEVMKESDYFFSKDGKDAAPAYFHTQCGYPVEDEEMISIFNKVFKPQHGMLFYKVRNREIYLVLVPLKHSQIIGISNGSFDGDIEKHAISFISEGSVNMDSMRLKLEKVAKTIKIDTE